MELDDPGGEHPAVPGAVHRPRPPGEPRAGLGQARPGGAGGARIQLQRVDFQVESPRKTTFEGLDLSPAIPWRTALVGRNGCGKTTLLRLLAGQLRPTAGSLSGPHAAGPLPFEAEDPGPWVAAVVEAAAAVLEPERDPAQG